MAKASGKYRQTSGGQIFGDIFQMPLASRFPDGFGVHILDKFPENIPTNLATMTYEEITGRDPSWS